MGQPILQTAPPGRNGNAHLQNELAPNTSNQEQALIFLSLIFLKKGREGLYHDDQIGPKTHLLCIADI